MKTPIANSYRDTWCGTVGTASVGTSVRVAGWVARRRDHGGLIFIDLRDRSGLVQLVFNPEREGSAHELAHRLRSEDVITASGQVVRRSEETVNPKLPTGEVEIQALEATILSDAQTPPFELDAEDVDEALRLEYRYLDLRREKMLAGFELRHRVVRAFRGYLDAHDFLEVETPVLAGSTPEGARDFLVPNRRKPGTWYALPQSPQLFKQILMVSGFERYYQVARCFRDEDLRADRQPEFTQLDLEMAFVERDDVLETVEGMMEAVLAESSIKLHAPIGRIPYAEAMLRYGTDRPDTRFGLLIEDLGATLADTGFKVFKSVLGSGGVVRGLNVGKLDLSRQELDRLIGTAIELGAKGLVWAVALGGGEWRSPTAKFLTDDERAGIDGALGAEPGDLLLLVADKPAVAAHVLGALRIETARKHDLIPQDTHRMDWVVDFPLVEWDDEADGWEYVNHPFTAATSESAALLDTDPGAVVSQGYDLVLDGVEIGGGSIRIHDAEMQRKVFGILGISPKDAEARFGFLLRALTYGAPPHGGIALGVDRLVAVLAGRDSIREVIAFPKTSSGADPLTGAPGPVGPGTLRELGVTIR